MNIQSIIQIGLLITTCVLSLIYLGLTFTPPKSIDPEDWKRKWIIFFAYLGIVIMAILIIMSAGILLGVSILPMMTNILILVYLGHTFTPSKSIDPEDWKRKWIIFFAWYYLAWVTVAVILRLSGVQLRSTYFSLN
jgi:hypothetical protein